LSLFETFKIGRLRQFSGVHNLDIKVSHKRLEVTVHVTFTYNGLRDMYDIDFVSFGGAKDVWDELSDWACKKIHCEINELTGNWRRSVGIYSRRKYSNVLHYGKLR
jgi:hypothetical protein